MRLSPRYRSHPLLLRTKLMAKRLAGREPRVREDVGLDIRHCADWAYCPHFLRPGAVVYSLGVGDTVEFDLAMISEHGATVHAFDPTPYAVESVRQQDLPAQFVFHPWAVAGEDGELELVRRTEVMWSAAAEADDAGAEVMRAPAYTLRTIMDRLGHRRVDLLKMDVEGSEYGIIEQLATMQRQPDQLLVEFHHRFAEISKERTAAALAQLRAAGYLVFWVSLYGREMGFVREACLRDRE